MTIKKYKLLTTFAFNFKTNKIGESDVLKAEKNDYIYMKQGKDNFLLVEDKKEFNLIELHFPFCIDNHLTNGNLGEEEINEDKLDSLNEKFDFLIENKDLNKEKIKDKENKPYQDDIKKIIKTQKSIEDLLEQILYQLERINAKTQ